ncbi:MAG TPA: PilZ domain-containing protein, partial [Geobacteraceae bacterium]|nr:PilZ domain-containing protein [Geobacteraceae bacterium]
LELEGKIHVNERREYARADVNIRLIYSLPSSQEMGRIMNEWEELKKCPGNCLKVDIPPCRSDCRGKALKSTLTRANLSGNGLRFKIRDCLSYGTLLHLKIAIPDDGPDHIHAVGSIVRTRELLPSMEQHDYYSTSVAFRIIDSPDRNKLMEYVLKEQRRAIL